MNLVFGGISEGVFAFFIIFCALAGMFTGAYLMDKDRFMDMVRDFGYWFRANLQNLRISFRHLPASFPCLFNGHHYTQRQSAVVRDEGVILSVYRCTHCFRTGRITVKPFDEIEKIKKEIEDIKNR